LLYFLRELTTPPPQPPIDMVQSGIPPFGTYLYTWVERSSVRVRYPAQEQNEMSPPMV